MAGPHRRGGPIGERQWWDPSDQAVVQEAVISAKTFGRGWMPVPMVANEERLDPYESIEGTEELRLVRNGRRLTALDEGSAWRQRSVGSLAVLRREVFGDPEEQRHRDCWQRQGDTMLTSVWQHRWLERDTPPGWIEARAKEEEITTRVLGGSAPSIDWFEIEDHTDPKGGGEVTSYQHLTIWAGRQHATLVVRHQLGIDLDVTLGAVGVALATDLV